MNLKGAFTIIIVTASIVFIALTSQLFAIWSYLRTTYNLVQSICILIPLNICILMTLMHYFFTCFTNPGRTPTHYVSLYYSSCELINNLKKSRYQDSKLILKSKNQHIRQGFAKHATIINHPGHIIVRSVIDVCSRWTIIVLGWIIVWDIIIIVILFGLLSLWISLQSIYLYFFAVD